VKFEFSLSDRARTSRSRKADSHRKSLISHADLSKRRIASNRTIRHAVDQAHLPVPSPGRNPPRSWPARDNASTQSLQTNDGNWPRTRLATALRCASDTAAIFPLKLFS